MAKARLAIIGTGGLAQSQHIPNLMRADHAELVTLCDLREDVLRNVAEAYPGCALETDQRKVLADPDIDGVVIATREDTHVSLTIEALAAGKHVYVEKPLAETEAEAAKVMSALEASGKIVAVGMNRRMAPAYQYARKLLDGVGGATNMFYRITDSYSFTWGRSKGFGPNQRIVHEVCHIFDIMRFFAASEVRTVYCVSARPDDEQIVLTFANGTVGTIMSSGYANSDFPKERFEAIAQAGAIAVNEFCEVRQYSLSDTEPPVTTFPGHFHPNHDMTHVFLLKELGYEALQAVRRTTWKSGQRVKELEAAGETDTTEYKTLKRYGSRNPLANYFMDKGWLAAMDGFGQAILEGTPFPGATAIDGLRAAQITEAAIQSRSTGQVISL